MPIFVQWKWKEETESFLVIFHFDNDYSKPNLRSRKMRFEGTKPSPIRHYIPKDIYPEDAPPTKKPVKIRTVMTWAPNHLELALVSQLLSYANIVNGLSKTERRELRDKLDHIVSILTDDHDDIRKEFEDKTFLIGWDDYSVQTDKLSHVFCCELCPEYIDYLKKVLKPYLK